MSIWVYCDGENRILGLNLDNLSGCTEWVEADESQLGLTIESNLQDERGVALYRLIDGVAAERPIEERQSEWPEDEPAIKATPEDYEAALNEMGVE